jgi:DUF1365 family protein
MTANSLYEGVTRHRRFLPSAHEFRFPLFLFLLEHENSGSDGATSESIRALGGSIWPAIRFNRSDYLDGNRSIPLGDAIRHLVEARTGHVPNGRVLTLTQLRANGYVFNPITVHYCLAAESESDGAERIDVVVLEVTNTPWKERHWYVIDARTGAVADHDQSVSVAVTDERGRVRSEFAKALHVSPFLQMESTYRFTAVPPDDRLWFRLESIESHNGEDIKVFDADLSLKRLPLTAQSLRAQVLRHPFQTFRVWLGIHLNAVRLALKRVPFVRHPNRGR